MRNTVNNMVRVESQTIYAGDVSERSKLNDLEKRVNAFKFNTRWENFRKRRTAMIVKYASLRRFYFWSRKVKGHMIIRQYMHRCLARAVVVRRRNLLMFYVIRWIARANIKYRKFSLDHQHGTYAT